MSHEGDYKVNGFPGSKPVMDKWWISTLNI